MISWLILIILLSGCINGADQTTTLPPSTVPAITVSTSTLPSTTTSTTTTSTLAPLPNSSYAKCDELGAEVPWWGLRCHDNIAIAESNPKRCKTALCLAYMEKNVSQCSPEDEKVCRALTLVDYRMCNAMGPDVDCIMAYSELVGDFRLCERQQRAYGQCAGIWANIRGDKTYCDLLANVTERGNCEAQRTFALALANADKGYCERIGHDLDFQRSLCDDIVYAVKQNGLEVMMPIKGLEVPKSEEPEFVLQPIGTLCDDHESCASGYCDKSQRCSDQDRGMLIDPRDKKEYPIVRIGTRWWMAKNLDMGSQMSGWNSPRSNDQIEKYCYKNVLENCDVFGGLYLPDEAMMYGKNNEQGICPDGWHIPSDDEWIALESTLGLNSTQSFVEGFRGTASQVGSSLRSTSFADWAFPNLGATDMSGFSAKGAGIREMIGSYAGKAKTTTFLTSDRYEDSSKFIWVRTLENVQQGIERKSINKKVGISIRCIMDRLR